MYTVSDSGGSPGGTHVQVFQVSQAVKSATYTVEVYSHPVSYTATATDSVTSIAQNLVNGVNNTTAGQWNSAGSAPAGGTKGFPPKAAMLSNGQFQITLNYQNAFSSGTSGGDVGGIGISIAGYNSVGSTLSGGNPYESANNLPAEVQLSTGNTITFTAGGTPAPISNIQFGGNFLVPGFGPIMESINPPNADGSPMTIVWARPGSTQMFLHANTSDGEARTSTQIQLDIGWGLVDSYDMRFVQNLVEGWESLPTYNSKYSGGDNIDTTTFFGWSAPIAAADQLDYFRRKQPGGVQQYFPDYIGRFNQYNFMSLTWNATDINPAVNETYGYPGWRRFTLDQNRPSPTAGIATSDMTDFGWWMNTTGLGNSAVQGTGNSTYGGTTARGLYDGLNLFYQHAGHSNVVAGVFKNSNKVLGTMPAEYVSGAENTIANYEQMVVNLINNDKPFIVLVSGLPSALAAPSQDPSQAWTNTMSYGVDSHSQVMDFNFVVPGIKFSITFFGYTVSYVSTNSDTLATIAPNIVAAFNAVPASTWINLAPSHQGLSGFPPSASGNSGGVLATFSDKFTWGTFSASWATGSSGPAGTPPDTIASSVLNSNTGPEYVRNIIANQLTSANANWQTLNDNNAKPLTPYGGLSGNADTATGNAYLCIGYCKPTGNTNLPTDAQNKFLMILKDTSSDREQNIYLCLDQPLTTDSRDNSLWSLLIATYIASPTNTTYVPPRPAIQVSPSASQLACAGVPLNVTAPLTSGSTANNRFTHIFNGVGQQLFNGTNNSAPQISNPETYTTPGNYQIFYELTDAVTHVSGTYPLVVNPTQNPQFGVTDQFGDAITGTPLHIASGNSYIYTPSAPINSAFVYTWSVTRTDAPGTPSDYTFTVGNANTAGPVQIMFNNAGQYNISLTTTGSSQSACPGQFTLSALVTLVTLDFTNTTPTFLGLPVTFTGSCNVAVSSWSWSFGDGGTDTSGPNPQHTYLSIGAMTVTLTVMTLYGRLSVTHILQVYPAAAVADFTYKPLTNIVVGQTIAFQDLSTPQPVPNTILGEWSWNFGDGNTSIVQNPQHAYAAPGIYDVTLTYTIFFGAGFTLSKTSSVTKQITIQSGAPIVKSQTFIVSRNLVDTFDFSQYTTSTNHITYSIVNPPANGDLSFVGGSSIVEYQPNTNYVGPDVFTFRATDNFGLFTNGNINLIVRPPALTVIVGEVLNAAGIITIRLGTTNINQLLLQEVVLQNTGTGNLLISDMTIVDDVAGVFGLFTITGQQVTNFANILLKPRDIFAFNVGIFSATTGTFVAKLQVDNN